MASVTSSESQMSQVASLLLQLPERPLLTARIRVELVTDLLNEARCLAIEAPSLAQVSHLLVQKLPVPISGQ